MIYDLLLDFNGIHTFFDRYIKELEQRLAKRSRKDRSDVHFCKHRIVSPPILRVNKQIFLEASFILYNKPLVFSHSLIKQRATNLVSEELIQNITHLRINDSRCDIVDERFKWVFHGYVSLFEQLADELEKGHCLKQFEVVIKNEEFEWHQKVCCNARMPNDNCGMIDFVVRVGDALKRIRGVKNVHLEGVLPEPMLEEIKHVMQSGSSPLLRLPVRIQWKIFDHVLDRTDASEQLNKRLLTMQNSGSSPQATENVMKDTARMTYMAEELHVLSQPPSGVAWPVGLPRRPVTHKYTVQELLSLQNSGYSPAPSSISSHAVPTPPGFSSLGSTDSNSTLLSYFNTDGYTDNSGSPSQTMEDVTYSAEAPITPRQYGDHESAPAVAQASSYPVDPIFMTDSAKIWREVALRVNKRREKAAAIFAAQLEQREKLLRIAPPNIPSTLKASHELDSSSLVLANSDPAPLTYLNPDEDIYSSTSQQLPQTVYSEEEILAIRQCATASYHSELTPTGSASFIPADSCSTLPPYPTTHGYISSSAAYELSQTTPMATLLNQKTFDLASNALKRVNG
ncbi:hypothetical protein H2203_002996 [Taxawa tesnikishii (nom. ined.)]|nr:hypothetical protein H2203_002996 [Dothideales sp. JES 119]